MTAWRREFVDAMELTIHGIELEDFSRTHTIFKIQNMTVNWNCSRTFDVVQIYVQNFMKN